MSPAPHPSIEGDHVVVDVIDSTIGVHDYKLTFRRKSDGKIIGYGWFDKEIAGPLSGEAEPPADE
jgi:hypothetical protein